MLDDSHATPHSISAILISNKHILDALRQHIGTMLTLEASLLAEQRGGVRDPSALIAVDLAGGGVRLVRRHCRGAVPVQGDCRAGTERTTQCAAPGAGPPAVAATAGTGRNRPTGHAPGGSRLAAGRTRTRLARQRGTLAADHRRGQGLRDLCPRHRGPCHQLEQRRRAHQGLHRAGNHRAAFLGVLPAPGVPAAPGHGLARGHRQRRLHRRRLALPQGRHALPGPVW